MSRGAAADRPLEPHARKPGGCVAARARARIPTLETRDATRLALESTHIYTAGRRRPVHPDRARIRARAAAAAEPGQAARRTTAPPETGARIARPGARAEGARGDRREAERRPRLDAGGRNRAAHRDLAGRRPGDLAGQCGARTQRAVAAPDLARETPGARGQGG